MGVQVTLEDGEKIDGEEFVIGMAASELSYIEEEEALKAWIIVCRTNFVKAVGENKEVNAKDLSLDYISREDLEMFLEAGCERIGTSSAVSMLKEE